MTQSKSTKVELICARCGNAFHLYPSQVKLGQGTYCSRSCQHAPRPLLPHPTIPDCLIVPLTKGKVALIDAGDGEVIGRHSWSAAWTGRRWYARRGYNNGTHVYMHRAILETPAGLDADHRNGDSLDNRRANLRNASESENMANRSKQRNNPSGYKGVRKHDEGNRFKAYIGFNRKKETIGWFDTAEAAARAYDERARELHGEFAQTNFD